MHNQLAKIEELVRVGLLPIAHLPILKRAIAYLDQGMALPSIERKVYYDFMGKFIGTVFDTPTLFRTFKQRILTKRSMKEEHIHEASTGAKSASSMSDDMKAQVAADIAKRKAKKEAALKAASKEMADWKPDKKDVRKIYQKESVEQLDELSKPTLKKYVAKATKSADKSWEKADKEEDKAMSTDGNKYPEKQKRHMDNAGKHLDKWSKRTKGIEQAKMKLREMLLVQEEVELQKAPEGMLMNFANIVKSKIRAGGKPTDGDKKLASRAKAELRRRRNVASKRLF